MNIDFAKQPASIIAGIHRQTEIINGYAEQWMRHTRFDASLTEFVRNASFDVFPARFGTDGERANFRRELRNEIRRLMCQ